MILEEQRFIHEDLERLEQGIADRILDEHSNIRDRLNRDHQVAQFLDRIESQSQRLLDIYNDADGSRAQEIQAISTGDPFAEFYKQLGDIKAFHQKYPNEPVENLEKAYKKKTSEENGVSLVANMFTGEEGDGRFLDLTTIHETYVNLPGVKRLTYLQYLETFDVFTPPQMPIKRADRLTDRYFSYVRDLSEYLESFMRRTKPLENINQLLRTWDEEFDKAWDNNEVPGWKVETAGSIGPSPDVEGIWCADCEKEFKNQNVYNNHLTGKKHVRAAEARAARLAASGDSTDGQGSKPNAALRLKERAVAERENRVSKLTAALSQVRSDTRVNVERKQALTGKERQHELEALLQDEILGSSGANGANGGGAGDESDDESDKEEKIYNPLKLPLAWDGKPIPYWLYKLHGLGVEYPCEICGNFVYNGRRDFDKHFSEARHVYGLKCLGITSNSLFRDITSIEDALKLWEKLQKDKRSAQKDDGYVVQMEDADGNVMPEKVYLDLQKQGLL